MENNIPNMQPSEAKSKIGWLKIFGIVVVATIIATVVAVWTVTHYIFPKEFKPVSLSEKEEQVLDKKLKYLDVFQSPKNLGKKSTLPSSEDPLKAQRYSEENATREIILSEKELNALLAKNTDLGKKLAIDLSDDLASAKLRIPLDEDFPFLGGKTLKVSGGVKLSYSDGKPIVIITGVSLWGVPVPNAWLGNIKNVDLVREFGDKDGFWSAFAAGIEGITIEEGNLKIKLKE